MDLLRMIGSFQQDWKNESTLGSPQLPLGYYANVIKFGMNFGVAITTDGVGSKAIVSQMMNSYYTIGLDCVAMNVNDLLCVGATPLSMVDELKIQYENEEQMAAIFQGLESGARQANISIAGGETAILPDLNYYRPGYGFDLSGTAIGSVCLDQINTGKNLKEGDYIVGIESNGIHSNGFTLARNIFFRDSGYNIHQDFSSLKSSCLGAELLRPTFIYVPEILALWDAGINLKAMCHITGDGLLNLNRVESEVGFVIDSFPKIPGIFQLIQSTGRISNRVMFKTFNMGIGFCVVVDAQNLPLTIDIIQSVGKKQAQVIGRVIKGRRIDNIPEKAVWIEQQGIVGYDNYFHNL